MRRTRGPVSGLTRLAVASLVALAAACGNADTTSVVGTAGAVELEPVLAGCGVEPDGTAPVVDTVATGLDVPWDVVFLPDGRALVTERRGRIRVIDSSGLVGEPWATLDVYDRDEVGLTGIDVGPDEGTPAVYVLFAHRTKPANPIADLFARVRRRAIRSLDPERGHPTTLRVSRIPLRPDGSAGPPETLISDIATFQLHGVGALRFGPDSMMYVTNGDGADPSVAQSVSSLRGKVLRYRPDGEVPADNPWPDSPIWVRGVRAVQGIDWDPRSGAMLVVDHGPSGMPAEGGRTGRDELNVVTRGSNLGWPIVTGRTMGGPWTSAIASWTPAIAPAGLTVYGGAHEVWRGNAFLTGLRGASLRRVVLDHSGETPVAICEQVLMESEWGRLRLVREAPDGSLWVGTSNRDGRGRPRGQDDLILRLRPS